MLEIINTDKAPEAVGPYSQAVKVGNLLFCSGQVAFDPITMQLVNDSIAAEAEQMFNNLSQVAIAAGAGLENVVKMTIYLTDMANFDEVNQVMKQFFKSPYPARACVAVKALPKGAQVEADAILALA